MNRQRQPRIDSVLPQPHSLCALRDPHTLDPRLSSRSSDLTAPNNGYQLPALELSERHKTHVSRSHHQLKPIQHP
jgi:hypothetical protein